MQAKQHWIATVWCNDTKICAVDADDMISMELPSLFDAGFVGGRAEGIVAGQKDRFSSRESFAREKDSGCSTYL